VWLPALRRTQGRPEPVEGRLQPEGNERRSNSYDSRILPSEGGSHQREALTGRLAYWAFRVDLAEAWSIWWSARPQGHGPAGAAWTV